MICGAVEVLELHQLDHLVSGFALASGLAHLGGTSCFPGLLALVAAHHWCGSCEVAPRLPGVYSSLAVARLPRELHSSEAAQ